MVERLKAMKEEREQELDIPDDQTRDKHLRSLRREDRIFDEEEEKEFLMKKLAARKKDRLRKHLFGIKDDVKKQLLTVKKKKEVKILSDGHNLLSNSGMKETKEKGNWMGKYKI